MFFPRVSFLVAVVFVLQLVDCGFALSIKGLLRGKYDKRKYKKGMGIVYSPYEARNQCKKEDQMTKEVKGLKGVSTIRIYGGDCNQIRTVLDAAKKIDAKVMLGVWNIALLDDELKQIIKDVGKDWEHIDTVAVGNELVDQLWKKSEGERKQKAQDVVAAVKRTRKALEDAEWKGVPVVTVDTWVAIRGYPELCQCSDYIAANAHPYFDGKVAAADSGKFMEVTVGDQLSKIEACKGKFIRITETGWPSEGKPNGNAKAGPTEQEEAVESILETTDGNSIILSAFNEKWKDDGFLLIEKHWGIEKFFKKIVDKFD